MVITVLRTAAQAAVKLKPARINITQSATMISRSTRGGPIQYKSKPFPYKEKKLYEWQAMLNCTRLKLEEENAKIIVVDGPIGVGKRALAKALAEEFDLEFFEDPTMDEIYINHYGYDYRQLDDKLPENMKSMDHKKFNLNPYHVNVLYYQTQMLYLRFFNYMEAMAHILNTGQGVVMNRSYFSDHVFFYSCVDEGYIGAHAKEYYERIVYNSAHVLYRPHLVIYLDVPVPSVQEKIKARGYNYEVNSKALTPSFLGNMEKHYKEYIKKASENSEILIYDWKDGGEIEAVVEDIEEIDFKAHEYELDPMYKDWKQCRRSLRWKRMDVTNNQLEMYDGCDVIAYDQPEMWLDPEEQDLWTELREQVPGGKYVPGANPDMGDKVLWRESKLPRKYRMRGVPLYFENPVL